jgi:hypothetical protein
MAENFTITSSRLLREWITGRVRWLLRQVTFGTCGRLACADRVLPHGVGFAVTAKPNGLPTYPQAGTRELSLRTRRPSEAGELLSSVEQTTVSRQLIWAKLQVVSVASRGLRLLQCPCTKGFRIGTRIACL